MKLDLHTHIWEATGFAPLTSEVAQRVIQQIKDMGIDGIAITDHRNKDYGFAFKELVDSEFPGQIVVIPGWEIEVRFGPERNDEYQVVELFLPDGGTFRSYCHPGYPSLQIVVDNVQAIEIDNLQHNWHIDKKKVEEVAQEHDLMLLKVSDAHRIEDVGRNFTEVDLKELYDRARPAGGALDGGV